MRRSNEGSVVSISGIVITLAAQEPCAIATTRAALDAEPTIELGAAGADRIPAVIDTVDSAQARKVYGWIEGLPGVCKVDVVFVSLDEESTPTSSEE